MAIEIRPLINTPIEEIYGAFIKAFEDYVIPIVFDQKLTLERWRLAGVRKDLSMGAFDKSLLVAFVLHSDCGDTLYNFCTGVIPGYRGRHLVESIYEKIDKVTGYNRYLLEVIQRNIPAHHLYKKLGFTETRNLHSYQGQLNIQTREDSRFCYSVLPLQYSEEMSQITLFRPACENASPVTMKDSKFYEVHELRNDSGLLAYAVYNPDQIGLKEIGARDAVEENIDQLFLKMQLNQVGLRIMNIDENAMNFMEYLSTRGLKKFISQYEMVRTR